MYTGYVVFLNGKRVDRKAPSKNRAQWGRKLRQEDC